MTWERFYIPRLTGAVIGMMAAFGMLSGFVIGRIGGASHIALSACVVFVFLTLSIWWALLPSFDQVERLSCLVEEGKHKGDTVHR